MFIDYSYASDTMCCMIFTFLDNLFPTLKLKGEYIKTHKFYFLFGAFGIQTNMTSILWNFSVHAHILRLLFRVNTVCPHSDYV